MTPPTMIEQVAAMLDGPCGKHDLMTSGDMVFERGALRLRDCPTCLPERIAAMLQEAVEFAIVDLGTPLTDDGVGRAVESGLAILRGDT